MMMNASDRNVIGIVFAQVIVKDKKSSHVLCALEGVEFDKNTKFIDVFTKLNVDSNFLPKYHVMCQQYCIHHSILKIQKLHQSRP